MTKFIKCDGGYRININHVLSYKRNDNILLIYTASHCRKTAQEYRLTFKNEHQAIEAILSIDANVGALKYEN